MSPFEPIIVLSGAIILISVINVGDCALPSVMKVCARDEPKLEQCIIDAVEHIRPNLANGDFGPEFMVPSIEPLYLELVKIQQGKDLQATFTKINIYNVSTFKLERIQAKPSNLSFDIALTIPKLNFSGNYALKMKILVLNLQGKGNITGVLSKVRIGFRVRGFTENVNGTDYVRFHRLGLRIKVEDGRFALDNLFGGDPALGKIGNQVINENSRIFIDEMIPGLERSLSKTFTGIVNKLLKMATLDDLFPEKVEKVDKAEKTEKVDKVNKEEKDEKAKNEEKDDKPKKEEKDEKSKKEEKEEKDAKLKKEEKDEKSKKKEKDDEAKKEEKDEKTKKDNNVKKDEKAEKAKE
ncbi:protein takeout-like [Malaya genurostris]|uniref:protein takeout-like n=1 Tax=Malaya genurostris TaxID=325434 RepID=UPI0026F401DA|nr:protein takeout-like [Malaya genurostris]